MTLPMIPVHIWNADLNEAAGVVADPSRTDLMNDDTGVVPGSIADKLTPLIDELVRLEARASRPSRLSIRDHVVSPQHGLDRVKLSNQRGPLGSFDRADAELLAMLRNNFATIIEALKGKTPS